MIRPALLALALLEGCIAYAAKYERPKPHRDERSESKNEIWVRPVDGKAQKRLGYLERFKVRDLSNPYDVGLTHYRIYDDSDNPVGRIDNTGSFYKYTLEGEYVFIGSWVDMLNGLKHFFGYGVFTNLYVAGVNPFRD